MSSSGEDESKSCSTMLKEYVRDRGRLPTNHDEFVKQHAQQQRLIMAKLESTAESIASINRNQQLLLKQTAEIVAKSRKEKSIKTNDQEVQQQDQGGESIHSIEKLQKEATPESGPVVGKLELNQDKLYEQFRSFMKINESKQDEITAARRAKKIKKRKNLIAKQKAKKAELKRLETQNVTKPTTPKVATPQIIVSDVPKAIDKPAEPKEEQPRIIFPPMKRTKSGWNLRSVTFCETPRVIFPMKCVVCGTENNHSGDRCAIRLTIKNLWNHLEQRGVCRRCEGKGHLLKDCPYKRKLWCRKCKRHGKQEDHSERLCPAKWEKQVDQYERHLERQKKKQKETSDDEDVEMKDDTQPGPSGIDWNIKPQDDESMDFD
ncbi:unnamed protein product [Caenorhabditis brenneri]